VSGIVPDKFDAGLIFPPEPNYCVDAWVCPNDPRCPHPVSSAGYRLVTAEHLRAAFKAGMAWDSAGRGYGDPNAPDFDELMASGPWVPVSGEGNDG
jgi:hypothetical protein